MSKCVKTERTSIFSLRDSYQSANKDNNDNDIWLKFGLNKRFEVLEKEWMS